MDNSLDFPLIQISKPFEETLEQGRNRSWQLVSPSPSGKNFHEKQILTITRVKNGPLAKIFPIYNGGGFNSVSIDDFPIIIT
jgi:hypothetical protein